MGTKYTTLTFVPGEAPVELERAERTPHALEEGPDERGVALGRAAHRERGDGRVERGGLEPREEPLRVEVAPERERAQRRREDCRGRAHLFFPREAGEGELAQRGEAADEVDDVREVCELAEGDGDGGDGGQAHGVHAADALHVRVRERERAESGECSEDAGERGVEGPRRCGCGIWRWGGHGGG